MIKIGEGESSEVFRTEDGKAIKLFKENMYEEDFFKLEFLAAKFIGDKTNIAPKVYDEVIIDSRHGYVMDEVDGTLFMDIIDSQPEKLVEYGNILGQTHRRIHEETITPDLMELHKCKDFLKRSLCRNKELESDVCNWLIIILDELTDQLSLLHGDFMPYNIMMQSDGLKVLDWAEPSLGPASLDIARTLNFIMDTTDYPQSVMTKNSEEFGRAYLQGYYGEDNIPTDELHKAFLINAASEVAYAQYLGESDQYSEYLKQLIIDNFSGQEKLISILDNINNGF